MTFDEWWATKDLEKAKVPNILRQALKDLAYEAWHEAWYESTYQQNLTSRSSRAAGCCDLPALVWNVNHTHQTCSNCGFTATT